MKKLMVIADWTADTLASQEFQTTFEGFTQDASKARISYIHSTPSTIHASYLLSQLVHTEERYGKPSETVFFLNVDPRLQTHKEKEGGIVKGAEFIIIRLHSGIYVCGPNAEYDFSLIKNKIEYVYRYTHVDAGNQFRSRDIYARIVAYLADGLEDEMDLEEQPSSCIPEIRGYYVGHIDNYGNIKTTITHEDLKGKYEIGSHIEITLNGVTTKATYAESLFGGIPGQLLIYPGSSGDPSNPYMELSAWSDFSAKKPTTGAYLFDLPKPGLEIKLQ